MSSHSHKQCVNAPNSNVPIINLDKKKKTNGSLSRLLMTASMWYMREVAKATLNAKDVM
jgi:hypothetical protein